MATAIILRLQRSPPSCGRIARLGTSGRSEEARPVAPRVRDVGPVGQDVHQVVGHSSVELLAFVLGFWDRWRRYGPGTGSVGAFCAKLLLSKVG